MPIFAQEMGFTEQSWRQWTRQHLEASLHVYIHLDHKSRRKRAAAIATSPLVLFMHLTNPSMHIGLTFKANTINLSRKKLEKKAMPVGNHNRSLCM